MVLLRNIRTPREVSRYGACDFRSSPKAFSYDFFQLLQHFDATMLCSTQCIPMERLGANKLLQEIRRTSDTACQNPEDVKHESEYQAIGHSADSHLHSTTARSWIHNNPNVPTVSSSAYRRGRMCSWILKRNNHASTDDAKNMFLEVFDTLSIFAIDFAYFGSYLQV